MLTLTEQPNRLIWDRLAWEPTIPYLTTYRCRKHEEIRVGDEVVIYPGGERGVVVRDYFNGDVEVSPFQGASVFSRVCLPKHWLIKL